MQTQIIGKNGQIYISRRTICSIEGCGRKEYAKHLCKNHYGRKIRTGYAVNPLGRFGRPKSKCKAAGCEKVGGTSNGYCPKHLYRFRKYGDPLAQIYRTNRTGYVGEHRVRALLAINGHELSTGKWGEHFDLLLDGSVKVEVKTAERRSLSREKYTGWSFNIHRHTVLNEVPDVYIFRLEKVPGCNAALHALFRSPLRKKVVSVSMRGLLGNPTWSKAFLDFKEFCRCPKEDMGKWKKQV